jgi:putative hemolysin
MPEIESLLVGRELASPALRQLVSRLLAVDRLQECLREVLARGHGELSFEDVLRVLRVRVEVSEPELARIPREGPVLVVANHPFGLLEGPVLGSILVRRRPDIKFLANRVLALAPVVRDYVIPIDVEGSPEAVRSNWRSLREGLRWLESGGLLVVLPAGEVAALRLSSFGVAEAPWSETAAWLARRSGAVAVTVFLEGSNGAGFHLAGLIHPRLRTALLPREFLNKQGRQIRVSIGPPVPADRLRRMPAFQASDYLRSCTELLGAARKRRPSAVGRFLPRPRPVAPRLPADVLAAEIESLPSGALLVEAGSQRVYVARAAEIPNLLREIGVLREIAFRRAQEGTGRSRDLDGFDPHYLHLFIWNAARREIVGAYRMCGNDSAQPLYTATLFRIQPEFFRQLQPALELGRSFIQPDYQRSYSALFLLWRGIGEYVSRNPRYRYLFGPVSISAAYTKASRALIAEYLRGRSEGSSLARLVRPAHQFVPDRRSEVWLRRLARGVSDLDELSEIVSALEADGKGIPVLLRHYLQLGAQVLEFSVDRSFSGVVDGLIVLDLLEVPPPTLARYLGQAAARDYWAYHGREFPA